MAEKTYKFRLFGFEKRVKGPFTKQQLEEMESFLEGILTEVMGLSARTVAYNLMQDKTYLPLILKISWDYIKLKGQMDELSQRLDEALRLAEFIEKRGGS